MNEIEEKCHGTQTKAKRPADGSEQAKATINVNLSDEEIAEAKLLRGRSEKEKPSIGIDLSEDEAPEAKLLPTRSEKEKPGIGIDLSDDEAINNNNIFIMSKRLPAKIDIPLPRKATVIGNINERIESTFTYVGDVNTKP